ncbi:hypothetical protein TNIN_153531 [Trichonephila inaurata madagascariensis]|uniref:Uncharacterized protein n=1 Tax=Trichonephila inaurata madagascariensis TaxID=2747483 RepID=A0A8X7CRF2_9ARAC|nr:hypothetical protein TNIN_153531 [Trichonephila inaurata madagascariensis]
MPGLYFSYLFCPPGSSRSTPLVPEPAPWPKSVEAPRSTCPRTGFLYLQMPLGQSTCPSTFMRSTDAVEAINQLESQHYVFRNPTSIITYKGSHLKITVTSKTSFISPYGGLPRSKGQIEKNKILPSLLWII